MAKAKAKKDAGFDKAELALDLYLHTDKSQKEICEIVGWTEKTFTANKIKNNWEELKGAGAITSAKIVTNLYKKLHDLSGADSLDADKLIKTAKAIEALSNKKATISQIINVFKDFTTWAFGKNAELAKEINRLQNEFINEKVNG
jgi:hypothetical protein